MTHLSQKPVGSHSVLIKLIIRCFVLEIGQSAVIHQLIGHLDSDSDIGQIKKTSFF